MQPNKIGIDLSAWNDVYDFKAVRNSAIQFAILRDGFATTLDKKVTEFYKGLKKAGVEIPAFYHFSYALNVDQAVEEANFSVDVCKKLNIEHSKDFTIFFDLEYDSIRYAKEKKVNLTPKMCNEFTDAFCKRIKELGFKAGVYFNVDFYKNWYDSKLLDKHTKWLAYWGGEALYNATYHQYYNKGHVTGIRGDVDMNYYFEPKKTEAKKSVKQIAREVLQGKWGNGEDRYKAITAAGYNYYAVQAKVNEMIQNGSR